MDLVVPVNNLLVLEKQVDIASDDVLQQLEDVDADQRSPVETLLNYSPKSRAEEFKDLRSSERTQALVDAEMQELLA